MAHRGGRPAASHALLHGELASVQAARAARHHPDLDPHFQLLRRALEYLHKRGVCRSNKMPWALQSCTL